MKASIPPRGAFSLGRGSVTAKPKSSSLLLVRLEKGKIFCLPSQPGRKRLDRNFFLVLTLKRTSAAEKGPFLSSWRKLFLQRSEVFPHFWCLFAIECSRSLRSASAMGPSRVITCCKFRSPAPCLGKCGERSRPSMFGTVRSSSPFSDLGASFLQQ